MSETKNHEEPAVRLCIHLEGPMADLWERMKETTGSSDEILLKHALSALAVLIDARAKNDTIIHISAQDRSVREIGIRAPDGLLTDFTSD